MSNLPAQSAVTHNDDHDDQSAPSTSKFTPLSSRITSPLIIKRQQNIETEIANNQAYDEIHHLQPKHSSSRKSNAEHTGQYYSAKSSSSRDLMQGNYYDQARYDVNACSSSQPHHVSDPQQIHINVDEYKKKFASAPASETNSNKTRSGSPPFGHTSESIQQGIAESAGILLEVNKKPVQPSAAMKNNHRSLSASSSSSSECSTSDSSTSDQGHGEHAESTIPYQTLTNDDDDDANDDEPTEQTKKPVNESSTLLNKNLAQSYGTQSTSERSKYLPNNGYNSHGSSITTKSSSDNSGSIRTNSGSDNDDESDEEHYNNSTASNHAQSTASKPINKSTDDRCLYSNEQSGYQSGRSHAGRSEQITNNDEHHSLMPRLKQVPNDDSNGSSTLTKLNSGADYSSLPYTSNWSTQSLSATQTNTLTSSSSSQSNRNGTERQEQQQHSNQSRNNARPHQTRTSKKRKQSQQQETIRTELIPGHRGDRDVDELVSFIDGNSSKQRQNSATSHSADAHKSKVNATNDANSNKSTTRKKSRKPTKTSQPATTDEALDAEEQPASNEPLVQPQSPLDDEDNPSADSSVDLADRSLEDQSTSPTVNHLDHTEVHSSVDASQSNPTKMSNGRTSLPDWFEQTRETLAQNDGDDDDSSFHSSLTLTNNSNSELISEPFVTVTHRRRVTKERRQDNHSYFPRPSRFPPAPAAPPLSSSSNSTDKRRVPSALQNGAQRSAPQQHPFSHKVTSPSVAKDESTTRSSNNHSMLAEPPSQPTPATSVTQPLSSEPNLDKRQSSPRLSSHSSSSSLSSLVKRQPKPPPVVFLNKSVDVELNDVSFGFDLDTATLSKPADEIHLEPSPSTNDSHPEPALASAQPTTNESVPPVESTTERPTRKSQQRNRGAQFYSGSDIRPHHHRPFPSQPMSAQSSYIDPLLLLQYHQQRLAPFPQPFAYMNFVRAPYVSSQSPYVLLPTAYPPAAPASAAATTASATSENEGDEATNQTSSEQPVEPPIVFATPTGPLYYQPHPLATKKPFLDADQVPLAPMPTMYATAPAMYPPTYFYPPQAPHLIASHPAYFQPIASPSLLVEGKADLHDADDADTRGDGFESVGKPYGQTRPQASSDIMSSALQLVYSQQRRNAQTDRFNLDDLTAYLAMKWTETVDNYEQGDKRIVLVGEQS